MTPRLSLLATALVLTAAPALAVNLPCLNVDPCVINSSSTIPVGLYDIRPRSLVIGNKQLTISGAGEFKVLANNITFQPGARISADSSVNLMTVTLDAAGTMDIQSQGTSKSKIDVSGTDAGGTINLTSVGNLSINGTLISNATTTFGFGGPITILSTTGNVTITGDPSEGIKSFGNAQGGGGAIMVDATLGSIAISTQIVPKGGDCGSCSVDLTAGVDITTTAQGLMDLRASGVGDGGSFSATAGGDVNLAGNILANGSSDDFDGGAGGDLLIDAGGSATVSGRIEINGAGQDAAIGSTNGSVDGDGGTVDFSSGASMTISGPIFGISKGFGTGDEFSFDALGDITLAGEQDISGDNFPGDITATADGLITVSARLRSSVPIDPINKPAAFAGTIDIEACQINVTTNGQLVCTGPGGDPSGSNELLAANGITVSGTMTATALNEFDYRSSSIPPVVTGTVVPAPSLFLMPGIPCCGPACPTTTTTTSTTSTTSTSSSSSSTSTSTVVIPTTSSSTVVIPTTSSSTVVPTTVIGTTSSSSTIAPTTSSTSSIAPASSTTTSTTQPGATTTSSSTLVSTTSTLATTTSTLVTTTSTSTLGSTTSTLGSSTSTSTLGSSTSTLATTTSTSSLASTTSTAAPTTSTTSVETSSSTSTLPGTPTTSTTVPPTSCLDTALGIDAVRCSLDQMSTLIGQATEDELGGHKLSKQLAARVSKATAMVTDPQTTKKLKKASRLLKGFSNQLTHGLAKRKTPIDPELGAELGTLVGEARGELAGLGF